MKSYEEKALIELAQEIIKASLLWTGKDEERNPGLKKIRTLAGYYINETAKKSPAIEAFDFVAGECRAMGMSDMGLRYALHINETLRHSDSLDRQDGGNRGGYYRDEASVYRKELARRQAFRSTHGQ